MNKIADPTAGMNGMPIKTEIAGKYRDVFDFVLQRWNADREAALEGIPQAAIAIPFEEHPDVKPVLAFIEKARQLFTGNQPIGQDFMTPSLALRFQDGTVLQFCDAPGDRMSDLGGSLDVSKHHPNREGKGQTTSQTAWGVTGNQ